MTAYWIAVASAAHVRIGRANGFMQVNHGKLAPLKRIKPGDKVAYYSPTEVLGDKVALQAFTAIGTVREGEPYTGDMGGGFVPYRRDVDWAQAQEVPIRPLLALLEITSGRPNWGGAFRFGLLNVSAHDFALIEAAMIPG